VGAMNWRGASESLGNGIKIGLILTIPAAVALATIPYEIINVPFGYGKYLEVDVKETANVLCAFAFGLPAYVLIRILQTGFFAQKDTKRPMKYGIVMVIVNIVLSFALFPSMKHVGLGIATSVAGWVNVVLLFMGLRGFFTIDKALWSKLGRITIASVIMAAVIMPAAYFCQDWINGVVWQRAAALAAIIGVGLSAYALAALLLKATSVTELKSFMKRA